MSATHPIDESLFLDETTVSYYMLGVISSDGFVSNKPKMRYFSIVSKDKDWLEQIVSRVSPMRPIKKMGSAWVVKFNNVKIVEWLCGLGCKEKKSLTLDFPKIPPSYIRDYVRGYFEGDGSISVGFYDKVKKEKAYKYSYMTAYICSGSKLFIDSLSAILEGQGFQNKVTTTMSGGSKLVPQKSKTYRVSFSGKKALRFVNWMYYEEPAIFLPRKFELVKRARELI